MAQDDVATIAYFTVVDDERTGWTGGLLVLNGGGRPLEFQCTLPVRPTRAHAILFGPTLREHLIGEVIGPLLVNKCRCAIGLLCCDQPESLGIKTSSSNFPIVLVDQATEPQEGPIREDTLDGYATVQLAGTALRTADGEIERVRQLAERLADLPDAVEPFERIRQAIAEAQSQIARAQSRPDSSPDSSAAA